MLHRLSTQIGQTETDNGQLAPAVAGYLRAAGIEPPAAPPAPYWGGALMAWAAIQDGITPPVGAIDAIAWLMWGAQLAAPVPGCLVVMTAGSGMSRMLIGCATRVQAGKVYVVGAWDGAVQVRAVPLEQIISARRPPGAALAPPALPVVADLPAAIAGPAAAPPLIQTAPMAPPMVQPGVTPEALQRLLAAVQAEFARVDSRIANVERTAVASISLTPSQ